MIRAFISDKLVIKAKVKKISLFCVKTLITLYFFYLVFNKVNHRNLTLNATDLNWVGLWSSFIICYFSLLIVSYRWKLLSDNSLRGITFLSALRLQLLASFLNQVIPTGLGGDVYKIYFLRKKSNISLLNGSALVAFERGLGLLVLMLISIASAAILIFKFKIASNLLVNTLIAFALMMFFIGVFLRHYRNVLKLLDSLFKLPYFLSSVVINFETFFTNLRTSKILLFLTCVSIHLLNVALFFLLSVFLKVNLPFVSFFIFPIVLLISALPISIAGWGLRESLMISGLGLVGVSSSDAFLLSVAFGATWLLCYLPIIPFFYNKEKLSSS